MQTLNLIFGLLAVTGMTTFAAMPIALTVFLGLSEYIEEFVFDGFDLPT